MNPYDVVSYLSLPYPQTHPHRLSLLGWLFGMRPAPPERCRVLEIGCASGGNLLPMAEMFPGSEFVGLDLAPTSVAQGNEIARSLGLANVELRHADVMAVEDGWGKFDYIICHGVYSWVPDAAKEKILDVAAALLTPQGIALVSHNVKPGWYFRRMAGEMMRYHVARLADPRAKLAEARRFIEFLVRVVKEGPYRAALTVERDKIVGAADWFLYHDQLADVNDACWLSELAEKLPARGLAYLGDTDIPSMLPTDLHPESAEAFARVEDIVELEQYHDFVYCRSFRSTAMCRAGVAIERSVTRGHLKQMWLATRATCAPDADLDSDVPVQFRIPEGSWCELGDPPTKRALARLGAVYPSWLPLAEVCPEGDIDAVALELVPVFAAGVVEGRLRPPLFVIEPGEQPTATPLARLQALRGPWVTNRRHENVRLGDEDRRAVLLCDGTRARAELPGDALGKLAKWALLVA